MKIMEMSWTVLLPRRKNVVVMETGVGQEGHHHCCCDRMEDGKMGRFSSFSKLFLVCVLSIIFFSALDVTSALRFCHQLSDSGGVSIVRTFFLLLWRQCIEDTLIAKLEE